MGHRTLETPRLALARAPWRGLRRSAVGCLASLAAAQDAFESKLDRVEITGSRLSQIDAETALPVGRDPARADRAQRRDDGRGAVHAPVGIGVTDKEASRIGAPQSPGYSGSRCRGFFGAGTLVLVDGRRLANYPFSAGGSPGVDLNAIPFAAIERVEILKDGASAIYGSDALGGVVNFILKKDFRGGAGELGGGGSEHGGGARANVTALFGHGDLSADGYNVFFALGARRQSQIVARDRSFAATGYRPEEGIDFDERESTRFPRTSASAAACSSIPTAPACTPTTIPRGPTCRLDPFAWTTILPKTETFSLLSRGVLRLAGGSELYAELLWAQQRFESELAPQAVNPGTLGFGRLLLPAGSPYYPTGLGLSGNLDVRYRAEPLGAANQRGVADQGRAMLGWRGDAAGWEIDSALALARGRATNEYRKGYIDAHAIVGAFATGLVNPFGASDPAGNALLAGHRAARRLAPAHGARPIPSTCAPAATSRNGATAGRARHRRRSASRVDPRRGDSARRQRRRCGPRATSPTRSRASAARRRSSRSSACRSHRSSEALLAARTDHFSDFGTTTSPKAGLRWQPDTWMVLRGSVGRGFRAPSLGELYAPQGSGSCRRCCPIRCAARSPARRRIATSRRRSSSAATRACSRCERRSARSASSLQPAREATVGLEFWRVRAATTSRSKAFDGAVGRPATKAR